MAIGDSFIKFARMESEKSGECLLFAIKNIGMEETSKLGEDKNGKMAVYGLRLYL